MPRRLSIPSRIRRYLLDHPGWHDAARIAGALRLDRKQIEPCLSVLTKDGHLQRRQRDSDSPGRSACRYEYQWIVREEGQRQHAWFFLPPYPLSDAAKAVSRVYTTPD